jgi:hypothetical protein
VFDDCTHCEVVCPSIPYGNILYVHLEAKVMQQLPGVHVAQAATCESVVYVVLSDTMICCPVRLLILRGSRRDNMGRVVSLTGTSSSTTCHMRDGAIAVPLLAVPCSVPSKELARFRGQLPGSHDDGSQMMEIS